jgi:hypothetical protein
MFLIEFFGLEKKFWLFMVEKFVKITKSPYLCKNTTLFLINRIIIITKFIGILKLLKYGIKKFFKANLKLKSLFLP